MFFSQKILIWHATNVCKAPCCFFHSYFATCFVRRSKRPCEFLVFVWTIAGADNPITWHHYGELWHDVHLVSDNNYSVLILIQSQVMHSGIMGKRHFANLALIWHCFSTQTLTVLNKSYISLIQRAWCSNLIGSGQSSGNPVLDKIWIVQAAITWGSYECNAR